MYIETALILFYESNKFNLSEKKGKTDEAIFAIF